MGGGGITPRAVQWFFLGVRLRTPLLTTTEMMKCSPEGAKKRVRERSKSREKLRSKWQVNPEYIELNLASADVMEGQTESREKQGFQIICLVKNK